MEKNFVFVVFSNYIYNEHKYNVLKECLESWISNENYKFKPANIDIKYISINPNNDDKMFIVSVNKEWLIRNNLGSIINNRLFNATIYLSMFTDVLEF